MKKILVPFITALALGASQAAPAQAAALDSCDETGTNAGVLCDSGERLCLVWVSVDEHHLQRQVCVNLSPRV